ncbi:hypothetical protein I8752_10035 [Nostocaceae cyanobacterium CENA369]|uniref:Uncharacterized protein n=1 Tax=Dendronalium phyllosphericum CENA369 TaxID=1725256 RepID=A0A8J7HZT9_9NOST|nr:hypothetical protein [Dendronalium phyllosphericum]MBH8573345.1 hypothetical protein [Dendronalium phyllosphericum CENA369]
MRQYRLAESLGLLPGVFFYWLPLNSDRIQKITSKVKIPQEAMSKDILIVD